MTRMQAKHTHRVLHTCAVQFWLLALSAVSVSSWHGNVQTSVVALSIMQHSSASLAGSLTRADALVDSQICEGINMI